MMTSQAALNVSDTSHTDNGASTTMATPLVAQDAKQIDSFINIKPITASSTLLKSAAVTDMSLVKPEPTVGIRVRVETGRAGAGNAQRLQNLSWLPSPLLNSAPYANSRVTKTSERSIDGTGNNPLWFWMGAVDTPLRRDADALYDDSISSPIAGRPNPRHVSNAVFAQETSHDDPRGLSNYVWLWGQFIDHDIGLTPEGAEEANHISVPKGDPQFDPQGTGSQTIVAQRSVYEPSSGTSPINPRNQRNVITTWLDGSGIYGSDENRARWLRSGEGGRLRTTEGDYPPFNDGTQPNAEPIPGRAYFVAGDVRANENIALTSLHTLFLREHNRLADEIAAANSELSDEQIYQRARRIVGAQMQAITYYEFLPALLGEGLEPYTGYQPQVDATISNGVFYGALSFGFAIRCRGKLDV
ncbi:MAG: peroxidase family protein [Myxococcota bacterium]